MIDISKQCDANPNYEMTIDDIKQWEKENGPVPKGAILMVICVILLVIDT